MSDHEHSPFTDVRCTRCGGARLARRDGSPGACSYVPCPSPFYDAKREQAEAEGSRVLLNDGGVT